MVISINWGVITFRESPQTAEGFALTRSKRDFIWQDRSLRDRFAGETCWRGNTTRWWKQPPSGRR
jgi:hypothetical protein